MAPSRRKILTGLAGLTGTAALSGCEGSNRPLWSADTHAADYPTVRAVDYMATYLRERTDGRIDIKTYAGGQLGAERDTLEMTIFGGLDMNRVNLAPLNPIAPATRVPALPFVFRSVAHMRVAMDGAPGQKVLASLEPHGLKGLCFYDSGARSFYNGAGPIASPDDMKGMKIRVQNSNLYVAMVEALGANATPMSFGEVYQALVQGVIDGAENNWPSYDVTRHFEAARYYSLTQHVMAPEVLVMSMRRWQKLSNADRSLIVEAARASIPIMRSLWDKRVEASRTKLLAAGVILNEIEDKAPFQERMAPVYERFVSSDLRALVDEINAISEPNV